MNLRTATSLLLLSCLFATGSRAADAGKRWVLVIHGGAGVIERGSLTTEKERAYRAAMLTAMDAGSAILRRGGSSLDAVEATIRVLEDDPLFNAGRGAVFTADGRNELDASIMDGASRKAGAVAGVTRTRNPISLARAVMEKSRHVMLAREGADQFSVEQGLPQVDPSYFRTEQRWQQLLDWRRDNAAALDPTHSRGTVGTVAMDMNGHVAAGTSTGGMTGKRWGRVGDSPLIGAGTYADDRSAAVSATGSGEYFIRAVAGHQLAERVRLGGESLQEALDGTLEDIRQLGGTGGLIAVAPTGETAWGFTTKAMYRGVADAENSAVAIYADEGLDAR